MAIPVDPTVTMGVPVTKTKAQLQAEIDAAAAATAARAATISPLANSGYSNANVRESRVTTPYGSPALQVAAAQADATAGLAAMNDPAMNAAIDTAVTAAASPMAMAAGTVSPVTGNYPYQEPGYIAPLQPSAFVDDPSFKILNNLLDTYDIKGVAATFAKIRADYPKISSENAMDLLRYDTRYNAAYLERFSGNKLRADKKLPMLDEKTYLNLEKDYGKVFNSYDLGSYANRNQYATLIGNDVSVTEATSRVSLAYDRVLHTDPGTLAAFKKFYPSLSTGDIVGAMLNPAEGMQALTRKVQSAEIGGAALNAGLLADQTRDMQLSDYGITKEMAQTGYKTISEVLPTASKLSNVYGQTPYTQQTGEQEAFNLAGGTESAMLRKRLTGLEQASFSGSSGTSKGSFSTGYLNKQNPAGQY